MTKAIRILLVSTALFFLLLAKTFAAVSPVGQWTTIDDVTHKVRSIIQITQSNGVYYGTIVKIYPQPGDTGICQTCPGNFKGKKILDLTIMWGMKATGDNTYGGGKILDPKSGEVYSCKMSLSPDGKTLTVRGYIGISLLGRSQTWNKN